jgi:N-acetylmuramoyl-L-alanine amidase
VLVLALLTILAWAAPTLGDVRVFSGQHHARILVTFSGGLPEATAEFQPAVGAVPARGVVSLPGCVLDASGARTIDVSENGVLALEITATDPVTLVVHLEEQRTPVVTRLRDVALLIDLGTDGEAPDPELPSADQLLAWVDGVSLVRAAGGPPKERTVVVVDAGHGGFDHGAIGLHGTREADIALEIARRTAAAMKARLGVDVILTRDGDYFVTLQDRAAIANRNDADLFLSIHANAAPGPTAWGIETYSLDTASDAGAARVARRENAIVRESEGETDPLLSKMLVTGTNMLSRQLAGEVQSSTVRSLQGMYGPSAIRNLGAKTALFYVLVSTRMPAILYECHFLTNADDEARARTPAFQSATAEAIVDAVGEWLAHRGTGP